MITEHKDHYVYSHITNDTNTVFYIGHGRKSRAWTKYGRNSQWVQYSKNGYTIEIISEGLSKSSAIEQERLLINTLKPFANLSNPAHVKSLQQMLPVFQENFTIVNTGSGLQWAVKTTNNKHQVGDVAGSLSEYNRWNVKLNNKLYVCARVIYLMFHGCIDDSMVIDHINGDPSNNKIDNLRQVSYSINGKNKKRTSQTEVMDNIYYYSGAQTYYKVRWSENDKRCAKYFYISKKQTPQLALTKVMTFRDNLVESGKIIVRK